MTDQQDEGRKLSLHAWEAAEGYMLIHRSTGLKFFCEPKQPTPTDPDNWNTYLIDVHADHQRVAAQAEMDGMTADQYVDYLAHAAMEMAAQALSAKRRAVS